MEPISVIAGTTIGILVPYFQEAGKGFAKKLGEAAWDKCEELFRAIAQKFQGRPAAQESLSDLQANPLDEDNQAALRKELKKAFESDPEFFEVIRRLVSETQIGGINVSGSGAVATSGGAAAGEGGIAIHGDVTGGIHSGESKK